MKTWTWLELKTKVQNDLDLQDETFITPTEMMGYCNEAIDDAEAEIIGIYSKYLETNSTVSLVSGTADYTLPTDIYATKITKLYYDDGAKKYSVKPLKNLDELPYVQVGDIYRYRIVNSSASGLQLRLFPTPQETSTSLNIWYIRNANRVAADTDSLDLPEAANYIMQHIKLRCYEKEGNPKQAKAQQDKAEAKQLMIATLEDMVPDENNTVEPEMSFYDDFYSVVRGW
jgi:hypothetical protein